MDRVPSDVEEFINEELKEPRRDAEKYVAQPDSVGLFKFSISVQVVILFDILLAHLDLGGEMGVGVGYVFDANF